MRPYPRKTMPVSGTKRLLNSERQRGGCLGDALGGTDQSVDVEGAADAVSSQVFERHIDDQAVFADFPALGGLKAPLHFSGAKADGALDSWKVKNILEQGVVERTVEIDHQRIHRSRRGRGDFPALGIDASALGGT